MQSQASEPYMFEGTEVILDPTMTASDDSVMELPEVNEPIWFRTKFVGCMEMYADAQIVAGYFDAHEGWFRRCAQPMKADPIGQTGYALTIGRFGSFGYQVEPKVGLDLLPQEEGVYRIRTIPVPDYTPPGYEVDFQAVQVLIEVPATEENAYSPTLTRVEWNLDLSVGICFPKFIRALPLATIQSTGEGVLAQIVKQVSRRLTYKVQEDFHKSLSPEALDYFKKKYAQNKSKSVCEVVK